MSEMIIKAIGELDDDIIEDYFKTKETFLKEKPKNRILIWKHIIPAVACFVLIFSGIFGVTIASIINNQEEATDSNTSSEDVSVEGIEYKYNGFSVSYELYELIKNAKDDDCFEIKISPYASISKDFIYEGKRYEEYNQEYLQSKNLLKKQNEILKDGELLKYGEILYTSGTPEGVKWPKHRYHEAVEYYGDDLLNAYIVDGEFLAEKLRNDILDTQEKINVLQEKIDKAREAYDAVFAEQNLPVFQAESIDVSIKDNRINIHLTKLQLSSLSIEHKELYLLDIAS